MMLLKQPTLEESSTKKLNYVIVRWGKCQTTEMQARDGVKEQHATFKVLLVHPKTTTTNNFFSLLLDVRLFSNSSHFKRRLIQKSFCEKMKVTSCFWLVPINKTVTSAPRNFIKVIAQLPHMCVTSDFLSSSVMTRITSCMIGDGNASQVFSKSFLLCFCSQLTYSTSRKQRSFRNKRQSSSTNQELPDLKTVIENTTSILSIDDVKKNPIPLTAIVGLLLLYLIAVVWTFFKEKRMRKLPEIIDLEDNSPLDSYHYFVTIYTGNRQGASTTSNVAIRLQGTKNKTKPHLIQTLDHQILLRNTVHVFLIATRRRIGNLTAVRVWHDNGGRSPEWFLQRMSILDPQKKECWLIRCDSWFDQIVDHLFLVKNFRSISNLSSILSVKLERYIKNQHLLFSVVAMQPWAHRVMSRRTRLSLTLLQIALTMAFTFFFYPKDDFSYFELNFYSFQWNHIWIGMKSAAVSYPITLFLTALFLYSKKRKSRLRAQANVLDDIISNTSEMDRINGDADEYINSDANPCESYKDFYELDESSRFPTAQRISRGRDSNEIESDDHYSDYYDTRMSVDVSDEVDYKHLRPSQGPPHRQRDVYDFDDLESEGSESQSSEGDETTTRKSLRKSTKRFTAPPISTLYHNQFSHYTPLPHFCIYLGWILIILGTIGSLYYSIEKGKVEGLATSKKWGVSVIAGVLEIFFLLETSKAILLALLHTIQFRMKGEIDLRDWIPPLPYNQVERVRHSDPEYEDARQEEERELNPAYKPTLYQVTEEKHEIESEERKLKRKFRDVLIHVFFLILLLISTIDQDQKEFYYFHFTMNNMIAAPASRIATYRDIYAWMNTTLAEVIPGGYKDFFTSNELIILGEPTLRQKRIIEDQFCAHLEKARKTKLTNRTECKVDFSSKSKDTKDYEPGWSNKPDPTDMFHQTVLSPWRYKRDDVPWMLPYYGERGVYDGCGYYVSLPKNASRIRWLTSYLQRHNWIDDHTRVVFLEFAAHNLPLKVFAIYTVAIETTSIGTATVTSSVNFMHSHYVTNIQSTIARVALYFILLFVFYHFYLVFGSVREHGFQYFRDFWQFIHFFSAFSCAVQAVLFLTRASYSDRAIQSFRRNLPSYHLFHTASTLAYMVRCFLSFSIFLSLVYTVKILYGMKTFELFHSTFQRSVRDLKGHSIYLIFVYFAFCYLGFLLFANTSDFNSFIRSMQTVFGYSMEAFTSSDLLDFYPTLGAFYLFAFEVMFTKVLVNFYATLLENNYRETKLLRRDFIVEEEEEELSFGQKYLRSMFLIRDQNLERFQTEEEKENYLKQLEKIKRKEGV